MSARKSYTSCMGLSGRIEAALHRRPCTVQELCSELGFSHPAIRVRLEDLMAAGKAHFVPKVTNGGKGLAHVWHTGPAPSEQVRKVLSKKAARAAIPDRGPIAVPAQVTTRVYVPTNRRDPLVAALFGAGPGRGAS